jgi:hypothetical protein
VAPVNVEPSALMITLSVEGAEGAGGAAAVESVAQAVCGASHTAARATSGE